MSSPYAGTRGRARRRRLLAPALAPVFVGVFACGGGSAEPASQGERPAVAAEIVQLRRDQVLERVEVAVTNRGRRDIVVTSLDLDVDGFAVPGPVPKDSPIPAGQLVNLPIPYGDVTCPASGPPEVGTPTVTLRLAGSNGSPSRTVRVTARDADELLQRVATRACAVKQVLRDVRLRFADSWRIERTADGTVAHGSLVARLRGGPARDITQVAGAIMYGLRPDDGAREPLASLGPSSPDARIPVLAWAARCDPHTIGEIKKPYEFLVWVTMPDGEELAVTPEVGEPTKAALRHVCAF